MMAEKPIRTEATIASYFKRGQALFEQAGKELELTEFRNFVHVPRVVAWFLTAHDRWAPSTIRQYRLSIREVLERLCKKRPDDAGLQAALHRLDTSPNPRPNAPADRGTSARKKKKATPVEVDAIEAVLAVSKHPYAPIAQGFLRLNVELGLRPKEWVGARIEGSWLIVANAKASNARGNGVSRSLDLSTVAPGYADAVASFIKMLNAALADAPWETIYPKVRGLLRAASKKAALTVSTLRGVVSPYTTRHVAAARARRTMDRANVAAMLGHATDRTAQIHYARPGSARGWPCIGVTVDPTEVATVRPRYRAIDEPRTDRDGPDPVSPKA